MNTFIYRPVLTVVDVLEAGACIEGTIEYIENHGGQIFGDTEKLLRFLDASIYIEIASNRDTDGTGTCYGDGSGNCDGYGEGIGYGSGYGDGSGYGTSYGSVYSDGDGSGYGSRYGDVYGSYYGDGKCIGYEYGDERPLSE